MENAKSLISLCDCTDSSAGVTVLMPRLVCLYYVSTIVTVLML